MFSLSFVFTSFRVIANIFLLLQRLFFGDQIFKTLEQVLLYKHLTIEYFLIFIFTKHYLSVFSGLLARVSQYPKIYLSVAMLVELLDSI